ncbi:Ig-like domain-containing protein [Bdellovibrio sp. ArHS]|uniref:Ig-like domain-containing protein n=1 Tax=Bdellovibrio sp. ArHS TaxID=1569284 RepID=UPI000A97F475|nr:Ig-like domain-containing protein [Bdellovibrio sp. ArHS]
MVFFLRFTFYAALVVTLSACNLSLDIQKMLNSQKSFEAEMSSPAAAVVNSNSIPVKVTFSEPVANFDISNLHVTNGSIANFSFSGTTCTLEVVPSGDGLVAVEFVNAPLVTSTGQSVVPQGQMVFNVDRTQPSVVLSSSAVPLTLHATSTLDIVFSEPVTDLNVLDFAVTNGVITMLNGAGSVYTATLMATTAGLVEVTLPVGAAKDAADNLSFASNTLSFVYDPFAPTPTLASTALATNNLFSIPVTVSFVSSVTDFDASDLTLENATVAGFTGANDNYSFDIIPTGEGTVRVFLDAGVVHNTLGTANPASNILEFTVDHTEPTLAFAGPSPALGNSATSLVWTVNYSGADTVSLTSADINLSGTATAGCSAAVSGSGNSMRTVTLTGCSGDGTVAISVTAASAHDAAGNAALAAGPSAFATIDNTGPSLSIATPTPSVGNSSTSFQWVVTYTGASTVTLSAADVSLQGSTSGCDIAVTGAGASSRTVTVSNCSGNGSLGISIAAESAQDSLGNKSLAAGPSGTVTVDNVAPTITLGTPTPLAGNSGTSFKWEVTYSGEDSISLSAADVILNGTAAAGCASKSIQNTSTHVNTVTITNCSTDGLVTLSIAAGSALDAAGNQAPAVGPSVSVQVDNSSLTSVLASTASTHNSLSLIPVTVTFADSVSNFVVGDLALTNAAVANFSGAGGSYSFDLIPSSDGEVGVQISAGVAQNSFGTSNEASNYLSFQVDRVAPSLSIGAPSPILGKASTSFAWVVTYADADAVSLAIGDLTLNGANTGCVLAVSGSGTTTRTVSASGCTGDGALTLSVAANTASDLAGNQAPLAGPSASVTVDNTAPTLSISAPTPTRGKSSTTFTWDITYTNADSISLSSANVTLTGATAGCSKSVSGSGAVRTVSVTGCTGNGALTISVAANTAQDVAGNQALSAGPSVSVTIDNTIPTLSLGSPTPTTGKSSTSFSWDVTYVGADTITIGASDITLNGATAGCAKSISGAGLVRTVTVTGCTGDGSLTVSVAANTAQDSAGNQALAAGPSSAVTVDNTGPVMSISSPTPTLGTVLSNFVFTVSYTGASAVTLTADDITLTGTATTGCSAAVTGSGLGTRTVTVSGCSGNGNIGISVAAGSAADVLGNLSLAGVSSSSATIDNTAPTLLIGTPTPTLGKSTANFSWIVTYAGADTITLAAANVTLAGTTTGCSKSVTGSGTTRTVKVTGCTGNGNLNISIAANSASDNAGNQALAAGPSADVTVDNSAPTLSISSPSPVAGKSTTNFVWDITYTGADTISLTSTHIALSGATTGCAKFVNGSGSTRVVTVTGCSGNGSLTISVASGTASDTAGNTATAVGPSIAATVDNTPPTVSFSYPSVGYQMSDGEHTSFYASGTCSDNSRTITFSPAASGTVTCSGGSWSATFDLTGQTGDTVTISANHTDAAGNSGTTSRLFNMPPKYYKVKEIVGNDSAFAALRSDGSVIAWGTMNTGGTAPTAIAAENSDIVKIYSAPMAFAALKSDGSVVAWGYPFYGADAPASVTAVNSGVIKIFSTDGAFAALKSDGSVVAWGESGRGGDSVPASITDPNSGVISISSTIGAFAALKSDGSVVAWGETGRGGSAPSGVTSANSKVRKIVGSGSTFAAIKSDGSVVAWGNNNSPPSSVTAANSKVQDIIGNNGAFAALKSDGSVVSWGNSSFGGTAPASVTTANSGVIEITANANKGNSSGSGAFAALKSDGSVVAWGDATNGGNAPSTVTTANSGVVKIFSTLTAFAALKSDGSVVAWGNSAEGGSAPTAVTDANSGVINVFSNWSAFAALKADGSVVAWGNSTKGGSAPASVTAANSQVVTVYSTNEAFAALKADGTVITWGGGGGNSSSVASKLAGTKASVRSVLGSTYAFAALKTNGAVVAWGESAYGASEPASVSAANSGVKKIYKNENGFSALKTDGSVVSWGNVPSAPASVAAAGSGVMDLASGYNAFAALKSDGSVVAWGGYNGEDSPPTTVTAANSNVKEILAAKYAFAALKSDGSVVAWGSSGNGGNAPVSVTAANSNVKKVYAAASAFAALKSDGSVVAWGMSSFGGSAPASVTAANSGVIEIISNPNLGWAFTARKADGSVVSWGESVYGGSAPVSVTAANANVGTVYASPGGFAALKTDGSVVTWWSDGSGSPGATTPASVTAANSGVREIFSNRKAFAALKSDGSLVTWGGTGDGGDAPATVTSANSGVTTVFSTAGTTTGAAFAALKTDGSVVAWGRSGAGGDNAPASVTAANSRVINVCGGDRAFAAIKSDGSVITWGDTSTGGNSTGVQFKD